MQKQQHRPPQQGHGIPLTLVRFRQVQQFGRGQRAIEIDTEKAGWHDGVKLLWVSNAVKVQFPDGKTYLVGHASVDTAQVHFPKSQP